MKLVRDRIPAILKEKGKKFRTHVASEDEYWQLLKEKLVEEAREFESDETAEELADVMEVISAICRFRHIREEDLKKLVERKRVDRGGFEGRIVLDFVE